jgi:hypothetical protein
MSRVAIIYDTSYLMEGREFLHNVPPLQQCDVRNIIPPEVYTEIANHLRRGDPQKAAAATGRRRITELEEIETSRIQFIRLEKPLRETISPYSSNDPLGPDSVTDRLLVAYVQQLAHAREYDAVVLASNDDGIKRAVLEIRSSANLHLFVIKNPKIAEKQVELLTARIQFGLSSGLWRPRCLLEQPTTDRHIRARFYPAGLMLASLDADEQGIHFWSTSKIRDRPVVTVPMEGKKGIEYFFPVPTSRGIVRCAVPWHLAGQAIAGYDFPEGIPHGDMALMEPIGAVPVPGVGIKIFAPESINWQRKQKECFSPKVVVR